MLCVLILIVILGGWGVGLCVKTLLWSVLCWLGYVFSLFGLRFVCGLRLRLVVCGLVTLVVVLVVGGFGFEGVGIVVGYGLVCLF